MKKKSRSEFRAILIIAAVLMGFFLVMMVLPKPQQEIPVYVYYGPAYGPGSIPCSSEINPNCIEYYPL